MDWADTAGDLTIVTLPGFGTAAGEFEQFRQKARVFLRQHTGASALDKLRRNERFTPTDLADLERLLNQCGPAEAVARAKAEGSGLGLFVRSLVGLDREAVKRAFGGFLAGSPLSANQIEFVTLVIDHLTEHGSIDPAALYDSPFTDLAPSGPNGCSPPTSWPSCGRCWRRCRSRPWRHSVSNTRTLLTQCRNPRSHLLRSLVGQTEDIARRGPAVEVEGTNMSSSEGSELPVSQEAGMGDTKSPVRGSLHSECGGAEQETDVPGVVVTASYATEVNVEQNSKGYVTISAPAAISDGHLPLAPNLVSRLGGRLLCASDFSTVVWRGTEFHFTPIQRDVIKYIVEAMESGRSHVSSRELLDSSPTESGSVREIFRSRGNTKPAWQSLVVQVDGLKGFYTLALE